MTNEGRNSEHKVILEYSDLIILSEFSRVITGVFQEMIERKLMQFITRFNIQKEILNKKIQTTVKEICDKIDNKNQQLFTKTNKIVENQIKQGINPLDLKYYQILHEACKELGIKKSKEEIEKLDDFPVWWN